MSPSRAASPAPSRSQKQRVTKRQPAARPPNVLFILADDLGWSDLSGEGSPIYRSPHIDRIAAGGMRFAQGYAACQVCSPSRASILTGLYPPRHGITDWIGARSGAAWREIERHDRLLPAEYEHQLRAEHLTMPQLFQNAGYRTFFAGKWHLGSEGSYPEDRGFQTNIGGWEHGGPAGGYFAPYANPKLTDGDDGESLPLRLGAETARFIDTHRNEPFFAFLSFYSVHGPIQTSRDRWQRYRDLAARSASPIPTRRFAFDRNLPVRQVQDCPIYGGMIEAMDDGVGLVLDALDRNGLTEHTIVCFTSDNGGVSSGDCYSTANLPLRGDKGRQWEGSIREPFYIRAPGTTSPGSRSDVPASGIDFFPTLVEIAGLQGGIDRELDGTSLAPLLTGAGPGDSGGDGLLGRDLFWHYPHYGNQGGDPSSIVRSGTTKLIHYYEPRRGGNQDELYDLATDPGEREDLLAGTPPTGVVAHARELRGRLDAWLDETDARLPTVDADYDAAAAEERRSQLRTVLMDELEEEHAAYLHPDWQPDDEWWGSQAATAD